MYLFFSGFEMSKNMEYLTKQRQKCKNYKMRTHRYITVSLTLTSERVSMQCRQSMLCKFNACCEACD
jgi:hypothetical protein